MKINAHISRGGLNALQCLVDSNTAGNAEVLIPLSSAVKQLQHNLKAMGLRYAAAERHLNSALTYVSASGMAVKTVYRSVCIDLSSARSPRLVFESACNSADKLVVDCTDEVLRSWDGSSVQRATHYARDLIEGGIAENEAIASASRVCEVPVNLIESSMAMEVAEPEAAFA